MNDIRNKFYLSFLFILNINLLSGQGDINTKLDQLFKREYIPELKRNKDISTDLEFSPDGLRPKGREGSLKWQSSNIRLMFLFKESNGAADAREYTLVKYNFLHRVSKLVYGFHHANSNYFPPEKSISSEQKDKAFNTYPHAYVNIKKSAGKARSNINEIESHAKKYKKLILKEIQILNPNIILCGGTFDFARNTIFADFNLEKINEMVFYDPSKKLVVIKAYHPASSKTNYELYDEIFVNYQKAIKLIQTKYGDFKFL